MMTKQLSLLPKILLILIQDKKKNLINTQITQYYGYMNCIIICKQYQDIYVITCVW